MQASTSAPGQRPAPSSRPQRQQTYPDPSSSSSSTTTLPATANPAAPGSVSGAQPRASSGSGRSIRSNNPDKQISQIEKSVTHLLVATKQLLETLTQWSRGQAQEEEVSDVYVRLGYEFNLACRAFNTIGVETNDLGNVPDALRHILEDTLSQPASPQALDIYLPRIRDIIINLLHGLKRKQSKLRGSGSKTSGGSSSGKPEQRRQGSVASAGSNETGLTQMLEDTPLPLPQDGRPGKSPEPDYPLNTAAGPGSIKRGSVASRHSVREQNMVPSESDSSMSSNTAQNLPVVPHYMEQVRPPSEVNFPHPPPPVPRQQDAMAALQRGGELERRASRRFSAYQVSKILGASPNGVPGMPAAQNSPIPNRGREARESMRAVQSRGSQYRNKSSRAQPDSSPSRTGTIRAPDRISEEREEPPSASKEELPRLNPPAELAEDDSPITKTPVEYHAKPMSPDSNMTATVNGPFSTPDGLELTKTLSLDDTKPPAPPQHQDPIKIDTSSPATVERKVANATPPPRSQTADIDSSPPQGKELTLFLQYKSKIKKFVLPEGYEELTLARLQLAFMEKFAWNTQNDGVDLPEIYIQDQVSGVRHELEDLADVKDRSVLVLNLEALDEVKKHFDDGIGGLQKTLEGVKGLLEGQGSLMQRFGDRQLEASKEMARMSALPAARPVTAATSPAGVKSPASTNTGPAKFNVNAQELQTLRRDIAVLRQTYSTMSSDFASAMADIRVKAANVKSIATDAAQPNYTGDAGRAHINEGKKQLLADSEALLTKSDDLADIVEELRKDVVTRGVRPRPRQLEEIGREISMTTKELLRLKEYVKRNKGTWTKIWEQELKVIMEEREMLTVQEDTLKDCDADLHDVLDVFGLIEEATKQQNVAAGDTDGAALQQRNPSGLRSVNLNFDTGFVDPREAKNGLLVEVKALDVNHEGRLEAIERAERARQRDLRARQNAEVTLQREVERFVTEGSLKKTGGVDEVERLRVKREDMARKENWETMQKRKEEMERKKAERAARMAAKGQQGGEEGGNGGGDQSQEGQIMDGERAANVESPVAANGALSPEPLTPSKNGDGDGEVDRPRAEPATDIYQQDGDRDSTGTSKGKEKASTSEEDGLTFFDAN